MTNCIPIGSDIILSYVGFMAELNKQVQELNLDLRIGTDHQLQKEADVVL